MDSSPAPSAAVPFPKAPAAGEAAQARDAGAPFPKRAAQRSPGTIQGAPAAVPFPKGRADGASSLQTSLVSTAPSSGGGKDGGDGGGKKPFKFNINAKSFTPKVPTITVSPRYIGDRTHSPWITAVLQQAFAGTTANVVITAGLHRTFSTPPGGTIGNWEHFDYTVDGGGNQHWYTGR